MPFPLLGAILAYFWPASAEVLMPCVLVVSASSFIYIATADLIPSLHKRGGSWRFFAADTAIDYWHRPIAVLQLTSGS